MAFVRGCLKWFGGTLALGAGCLLVLAAAPASAEEIEPSCRYIEQGAPGPPGNALEVSLGSNPAVEIERVGDRIRVNGTAGGLHREIACDFGSPTVHNIDTISLVQPVGGGNFIDIFGDSFGLSIDLTDGLLAPGATPEADGSEIEVEMPGGQVAPFTMAVITTPGPDQVRALTTRKRTTVNLNGGEVTQDTDIDLPPVLFGAIYAGAGNDVIVSKSKLKLKFFFPLGLGVLGEGGDDWVDAGVAAGGDGADNLVGGPGINVLIGGAGSDAVRGKNGIDFLASAGGHDLLLGGGGGDFLYSDDGNGDKARCGDGRDQAVVDRRDKRSGCERLKIRRGRGSQIEDDDAIPFKIPLRTRSGEPIF